LIRRQLQDRLHIGLEERVSARALVEEPTYGKKKVKSRQLKLPFKSFAFGVQEGPNNRVEWRKHWLALLLSTLWPFLLTLFSAVMFALMIGNIVFQGITPGLQSFITLAAFVTMIFGFFWLWWSWTDWDNDRYILTDKDIEHIEQKPLFFDEQRQITTYERVQNVEFRKPNPLFYLLNFGYVDIQTAATEGMVTFRYVPEPDFVQTEIYRRMETYRSKQAELRLQQQKSEMIDWLDAYHKLVQQDDNNFTSAG